MFPKQWDLLLAAEPKFKLLAHNTLEDDSSRANASIAAVNGELLLRTDQALYCIAYRYSRVVH
jgi:outer membrane protein assembly factor BamB